MRHLSPLLPFFVAVLCLTQGGCGSGAPADFPKLAPCKITVKKGDTPVADVDVFLTHKEWGMLTIKGTTNASGVADIQTLTQNYSANGAPVGQFSVHLKKDPPFPVGTKTREELDSMGASERDAYAKALEKEYQAIPRDIPQKYSSATTSGLSINVEAGKGGTLEVDISGN